jgi:linalool 8-monooxygenase
MTEEHAVACPGSPSLGSPGPAARRAALQAGYETDLKNPDLYVSGAWAQAHSKLRDTDPVYWNEGDGSNGFWAVTQSVDAETVLQNPEIFSADYRNGGIRIFDVAEVTPLPRPDILSIDPPNHGHFRKALQPAFTRQTIDALTVNIRRRARDLVAAIAVKGHAEFVTEVAQPLTIGLLVDLLGVPETEAPQLIAWSNLFVGDDDPDFQIPFDKRAGLMQELDAFVGRLLEERRDGDGIDLISLLTRVRIEGEPLDFEALCVNFGMLIVAVNETTRHAISGSIAALSAFPEERRKLLENPDLIPTAAKELIRWVTPLRHVRRTATHETVLGGKTIRKGEKVVVWYSSANRDEAVWADASTLRVDRYADKKAAPHMAFGSGAHFCLGWRYAEIQMSALLEEVLRVLPDIRCDGPASGLRSNFVAGIKAMPVVFTVPAR